RVDVALDPAPVAETSPAELFAGAPNPLVDDGGLAFARLDRRRLARAGDGDGGATGALVGASAAIVGDATLIAPPRPLTGRIAHTRVLMRRRSGEAGDLGNHLETTFTETREAAPKRRPLLRLPGIEQAQTSSWSQHLVAKALPPIARLAMRIWIARFDAMISLIPGPTRPVALGGAGITAVYGVPPLSGPIPLAVAVITYAGTAHLTVIPGRTAQKTPAAIAARMLEELERRADSEPEPATANRDEAPDRTEED
ncbi:MAG: WS/DGAT domain-containing protein, partial [Hyphomicrobiales bacterium]